MLNGNAARNQEQNHAVPALSTPSASMVWGVAGSGCSPSRAVCAYLPHECPAGNLLCVRTFFGTERASECFRGNFSLNQRVQASFPQPHEEQRAEPARLATIVATARIRRIVMYHKAPQQENVYLGNLDRWLRSRACLGAMPSLVPAERLGRSSFAGRLRGHRAQQGTRLQDGCSGRVFGRAAAGEFCAPTP